MKQFRITERLTDSELQTYITSLSSSRYAPFDDPNEEIECYYRCKERNNYDEFINHNLLFVVSVAKKYYGYGEILDIVQAGNEGLIKAAHKFDPTKGFKFISYAIWWIQQSINAYVENNNLIHIPINVLKNIKKEEIDNYEFWSEHGLEERTFLSLIRLDLPSKVSAQGDRSEKISDGFKDDSQPELFLNEDIRVDLMLAIETSFNTKKLLKVKEVVLKVLENPDITNSDLADEFHVSLERARQLRVKGLEILSKCNLLKKYL